MKVIDIDSMELFTPERIVNFTGGVSYRPVLASDGVGFSVHKTIIPKGGPHHWHYKNHFEVCYCIAGEGELTNLQTGHKWIIIPDKVYILDEHDDHTFEALEDTILISIFNPPIVGDEHHDENGVYELKTIN
jgi:L-ectoine synthase